MPRPTTALLLLAVALVYWPVLRGEYVYDDLALIAQNGAVTRCDVGMLLTAPFFGAEHPYWRPVTMIVLAVGNKVAGAAGIHAIAMLLHAANTLLVAALAQRWLGASPSRWGHAMPALLVALLFAVHPVQVESVAWCAAVNDPLWVFFALMALRSALRFVDSGALRVPWATSSLLLLALSSKENAIAIVPIIWLVAAWSAPKGRVPRVRLGIGIAVALFGWWLLRALVFRELSAGFLRTPEMPPIASLLTIITPFELLLRHVARLLVPQSSSPFLSFEGVAIWRMVVSTIIAFAAGVVAARRWRGLAAPLRIGVVLLLVPLLPPLLEWRWIGAYPVADRYLYVSTIGFALLLVHALRRFGHGSRAPVVAAAFVVGLGAYAFVQTGVWRNQERLVQSALASSPDDPRLSTMAGALALRSAQGGDRGALEQARRHYEHAAETADRRGAGANRMLGEARLGLAWCLALSQGARADAEPQRIAAAFRKALDADPDNASAWSGLGVALGMANDAKGAEAAFQRGLQIDPRSTEGWFNLGRLYLGQGRRGDAQSAFERALDCDPGNRQAAALLEQCRRGPAPK